MNVLFAASEGHPFIKTGGLGDVIGALPKELQKQGINVSVILPKYEDMNETFKEQLELKEAITVPVGWRHQYCGIETLRYNDITYYFIDNEYYFKRSGSYGYFDDGERFSFFCRAVLEAIPYLDEQPDILHCHDWQTGMIPVLKKAHYRNNPYYDGMKVVYTIHNLRYQGIFPKGILHDLLDLSELHFTNEGVEFHGNVSFMKGGLLYSDYITTVSPSYADEIKQPYFGEYLDGILRKREDDFTGIINGIDSELYDPAADSALKYTYHSSFLLKEKNKIELQEKLGLQKGEGIPVLCMITRLVEQKGMDLFFRVLPEIMEENVQVVVLGTGDEHYEHMLREAENRYPGRFSANIYFDEAFARKLYASSDLFLMPSQFEPCGISQLIALRYGSLPIVRETGGLKDTVIPYNKYTGEGHGFSFADYNAHDMLNAIRLALHYYHHESLTWRKLVERGMRLNYSWEKSAEKYSSLYESLVK
ncbi:glycogen synthase GlgA [Guptibacillus algicola]|uniref:glycogen synthase GlgA n=1 Tax=Guptibacillus algicola TaxID=225844 RepID=UPI001CD6476A|nr:glycogen synthase GlgA [Alkalihalobacillus algicola]MCA0988208.1 glycogen synthase GlgA [Alkalihalobacillus algicola]